eukprot:m.197218 g.197218  ORF g.197218 m.197218 type:complete len:515 (+) comp32653_c0_seq1:165-1709(+)
MSNTCTMATTRPPCSAVGLYTLRVWILCVLAMIPPEITSTRSTLTPPRRVLRARDFVSSGQGSIDDPFVGTDGAAGILAAMKSVNYGIPVTILIDAGFSRINSSLNLHPDTVLVGVGMNATVLINKPYQHMESFGTLPEGAALYNLTVDGNRYNPMVKPTDCNFQGFQIKGPNAVINRVQIRNFACGGVLPHTTAQFFQLTDSMIVDSHFGLWAEATCGYASHLIARNHWVSTNPGAQDAMDYDNGNADGILNCSTPATAAGRRQLRNHIVNNTVVNTNSLGIAVARMGGFTIENNLVIAPGPTIRNCSYNWCNANGGNSIHIEHESYDIEIINNRVVQGECSSNCSVSVGIWIADSANVTVEGNTIVLANSTRDCIQYAADFCTNAKPNHDHDVCVARANLVVRNNSGSGCRSGMNIWGNGTVGITDVLISDNVFRASWMSGVSVGSARRVQILANIIDGAPVPVLVHAAAYVVGVLNNMFANCTTCNITYVGNPATTPHANASNNTCAPMML